MVIQVDTPILGLFPNFSCILYPVSCILYGAKDTDFHIAEGQFHMPYRVRWAALIKKY
jgi:hypothetical protein